MFGNQSTKPKDRADIHLRKLNLYKNVNMLRMGDELLLPESYSSHIHSLIFSKTFGLI